MKNDERYLNLRFVFVLFVGMIFGILFCRFFLTKKINIFIFILSFVLIILLIVFAFIYAQRIKLSCENSKFRKNIPMLIKCCSIGFAVAYIIGILFSIIPMINIMKIKNYDNEIIVSGVVSDYIDREETYVRFIVKNCQVLDDGKSENLKYKIVVNSSSYCDVKLGDYITFKCELDKYNYNDQYGFSQLVQGIAYNTYISVSNLEISDGELALKDKVHKEVKNILDTNLNEDNSEICFAILFGQKHGLSSDIKSMFSYSGISHILAVSGLHIGVLVSLIWFALNKLKINDYIKLSIFVIILFFYSYLCGFAPSVCRASLMALVLALSKIFLWEYDITNSLGFAGIVILLFKPMYLFSISFQLSFMCIYAIITFAPFLKKSFNKIKCPKVLADTLAVSIAVNIVILPVCVNAFKEVSLLGIFANILVLPIFNIAYILLFTILIMSLIIKPLGIVLAVPNLLLHLIKTIAYYFSLIPFGVFRVFNISYLLIFVVSLITFIIHFLMTKRYIKLILVSILSLVSIVLIINGCVAETYNNKLLFIKQYNSNVVLYCEEDENILIGSDITLNNLLNITKNAKIKKIDKIIAYDLKLNNLDELVEIKEMYKVKKFIIPNEFNYNSIINLLGNIEFIDNEFNLKRIKINLIEYKNDCIAVKLVNDNSSILIPVIENSKSENQYLIYEHSEFGYVVTDDISIWIDYKTKVIDISNLQEILVKEF